MKKLIIIAIIAMIAMIGTTSAVASNIVDEFGVKYDYEQAIAPNTTYICGVTLEGGPTTGDIQYVILPYNPVLTINQLKTTATLDGNDPFTELGVFEVNMTGPATIGNIYTVTVETYLITENEEAQPTSTLIAISEVDLEYEATGTQRFTPIPEFPTIALPVAAILGLAFFMQRRKEE